MPLRTDCLSEVLKRTTETSRVIQLDPHPHARPARNPTLTPDNASELSLAQCKDSRLCLVFNECEICLQKIPQNIFSPCTPFICRKETQLQSTNEQSPFRAHRRSKPFPNPNTRIEGVAPQHTRVLRGAENCCDGKAFCSSMSICFRVVCVLQSPEVD